MAVIFTNGFNIMAPEPVDIRIVKSKAEMAGMTAQEESRMPNVYFCICSDDNKVYTYNKSNTPIADTGRFRLYTTGGGGGGAVESVNGKTGAVWLNAADVGALPTTTVIPTKTSQITNDSGYITNQALSVYRTAAQQDGIDLNKQSKLVSGENIKTINNISLLGSGNIDIQGGQAYSAGDGINISEGIISVDDTVVRSADIADMATKTWVEDKGYLTNQSLTGYATEAWVEGKGYLTDQSLTGYATKTWVEDKGYLTEHQDISGKQDKLTEGSGISILSNVISTTITDKLKADIVSDFNIGGIKVGDVLTAGTSFEYILNKLLLSTTPISVDIYVGAVTNVPPTSLTELDKKVVTKNELISSSGLDYIIKSGDTSLRKAQFRVIACPTAYKLVDWVNKATTWSMMDNVTKVVIDNYNVYYLSPAAYDVDLGGEEFIFKFEEE